MPRININCLSSLTENDSMTNFSGFDVLFLIEFFSFNYSNIAFNFKGKSRAQNLKDLGDRRGKGEKK